MAELTPEERMDRIEALLARLTEVTNKLRTFDELDAVVQEIFGEIETLGNRIEALEHNLDMVESTVSPPNG